MALVNIWSFAAKNWSCKRTKQSRDEYLLTKYLEAIGSSVSPQKEDSWKNCFTTSKFEKGSSVQAPSWGSMFSFWSQTMFSLHPECAVVHHSQIHSTQKHVYTVYKHMHTAYTTQISFNYMLCICISRSNKYILYIYTLYVDYFVWTPTTKLHHWWEPCHFHPKQTDPENDDLLVITASWNKPDPEHQLFIQKEIYLISRGMCIFPRYLIIQTPFEEI